MKEFFRQQLNRLHLVGIRQMEYLSANDIEILLDELVRITKKFSYIPEARQQVEIEKQLIEDLDAKDGLTLRNVWKWMYKISPLFWKGTRMTEEELTPKGPILEGEARQAWLDKWREELDKVNTNFLQEGKGGGSRLKESLGIEKAQSVGVIKNYEIGGICGKCEGMGIVPNFELGEIPKETKECNTCNGTGKINIVSIPATSEEEARKQYTELFGGEITKKP